MNRARWRDAVNDNSKKKDKRRKEQQRGVRDTKIYTRVSFTHSKKNARASTPFHSHTTTSLPLTEIKVKIEALKGRWLLLIDIRGLKKTTTTTTTTITIAITEEKSSFNDQEKKRTARGKKAKQTNKYTQKEFHEASKDSIHAWQQQQKITTLKTTCV